VPPCWVRGEVSNLRKQSSGHVYFTLKDEASQLSVVLFRGNASRQSIDLRDGMQLIVYGELSLYEPRGSYQMIARALLEDGLGRLRVAYDALKAKLEEEGLFDRGSKQPLPILPRRIGIITSPTGAAIRDFISILKRRFWQGELIVFPAQVQGDEAVPSIVDQLALAQAVPGLDLLVLARGGGSLEDLWTFNEELLVRAVALCTVPTLSAVGHETDVTLCDFASDARAETPSGAAELITSHYVGCLQRCTSAENALEAKVVRLFNDKLERIVYLKRCLLAVSPQKQFEYQALKVDDASRRLVALLQKHLWQLKAILRSRRASLVEHRPVHLIRLLQARLQGFAKRLDAVSLEKTLQRGFSMIRNEGGQCIYASSQLKAGQLIDAQFRDGSAKLKVEDAFPSP